MAKGKISMRYLFALIMLGTFLSFQVSAQDDDLLIYLSFDSCRAIDDSQYDRQLIVNGTPECKCGPEENSATFFGSMDNLTVEDTSVFFNLAFTMSFYFKPFRTDRRMLIMSKAEDCGEKGIWVFYDGPTNSINIEMSESLGERLFFAEELDVSKCWNHVVLERSGERNAIWLNGEKKDEKITSGFLEFENNGFIQLATGVCVPLFYQPFEGSIDEFRIYDKTYSEVQVSQLYGRPNRILTDDTTIFLGDSFVPRVYSDCGTDFSWTPTTGVTNPSDKEPTLAPTQTTTYTLQIEEEFCEVYDTIKVVVVDPDLVSCEPLLIPTAFTPNGDGINDEFFISNYFVLEELKSFDIYDRWGNVIFHTTEIQGAWDGRYRGEIVMPGVYVYKARYVCEGEEKIQSGSFSVLN